MCTQFCKYYFQLSICKLQSLLRDISFHLLFILFFSQYTYKMEKIWGGLGGGWVGGDPCVYF